MNGYLFMNSVVYTLKLREPSFIRELCGGSIKPKGFQAINSDVLHINTTYYVLTVT